MKTKDTNQIEFEKIWGELSKIWRELHQHNAQRRRINTLVTRCRIDASAGNWRLAVLDIQISVLQNRNDILSAKLQKNPVMIELRHRIATMSMRAAA